MVERCSSCGMLLTEQTEKEWIFHGAQMVKLCIFCKPLDSYKTDLF